MGAGRLDEDWLILWSMVATCRAVLSAKAATATVEAPLGGAKEEATRRKDAAIIPELLDKLLWFGHDFR